MSRSVRRPSFTFEILLYNGSNALVSVTVSHRPHVVPFTSTQHHCHHTSRVMTRHLHESNLRSYIIYKLFRDLLAPGDNIKDTQ